MKKLLVVAGAGASVEFGMPSVKALGSFLEDETQKLFPLADDLTRNLYGYVVDEVAGHFKKLEGRSPESILNFEGVMHVISLMGMFYSQGILTSPLGAFAQLKQLEDVFQFNRRQPVDENVWRDLGNFLSDTIVDCFRNKCAQAQPSNVSKTAKIKDFLRSLCENFDVSVVTVNYDNIIYKNIVLINTGFDKYGIFKDSILFKRDMWPCMLHLHGSVHFQMVSTQSDLASIRWEEDLSAIRPEDAYGRGPISNNEGLLFPSSVIVAGYGKSVQMLRRPFRTYYSELDRLVSTSDALLCLGYGFGDTHLNLALVAYRDDRHRPVVIVDWADDNNMSASAIGLDGSHNSISRALQIFSTAPYTMQAFDRVIPGTVKYLKEQRTFDVSTNPMTPLAIWYNGMYAACENPDAIVRRLT